MAKINGKVDAVDRELKQSAGVRAEFKTDPIGFIEQKTGITLNDEQRRKLGGKDWANMTDAQVQAELNNGGIRRWL